jgi:outer membrane protein assembly factor BamB
MLAAQRLRNGEFAVVLNSQRFVRLDASGKELKAIGIGAVHNYVQFDILPNGNVLIPQQGGNKLVEFDPSGKSVWEAPINFPFAAQRLPNGRTLTASLNANQVVELDRSGKEVWRAQLPGPSWRARRR